jgi:hypothetical protein
MTPYVKNILEIQSLDFVCLQETIIKELDDGCIRRVDPGSCFLWDWVPSVGRSGELISGIKSDRFDVGGRTQGNFILKHNLWDKVLERKWNLLNVYGAPHDKQKEDFMRELAEFCAKNIEPFIIGGDFNVVRFGNEKNKNYHHSRFSDVFNSIIQTHELREIPMFGGGYTWSNNRESPTIEKLDRVLVTREWESLFPNVWVYKLPRDKLDHNPLVVDIMNHQRMGRNMEFRFELSWLKHKDFLERVGKVWEAPTRDSIPLDRVLFKLKKSRNPLRGGVSICLVIRKRG